MTLDNEKVTPASAGENTAMMRGLKILVVGLGVAIIFMIVLIIVTAISRSGQDDLAVATAGASVDLQKPGAIPQATTPQGPVLIEAPEGMSFDQALVFDGKVVLQFRDADGGKKLITVAPTGQVTESGDD